MTKKPQTSKDAAEKVVKNIRRKTRQTGSVKRMRTRIGLLAQPESMRSIIGATQQERRFD